MEYSENKLRQAGFIKRQYNTGIWIGLVLAIYGTACAFIGMVGQLMSASVFYTINVKPNVPEWFTMWVFLLFCLAYVLGVMLVAWKIVIPSQVRFSNKQGWQHSNPARELMEERFHSLDERMERIERLLKGKNV